MTFSDSCHEHPRTTYPFTGIPGSSLEDLQREGIRRKVINVIKGGERQEKTKKAKRKLTELYRTLALARLVLPAHCWVGRLISALASISKGSDLGGQRLFFLPAAARVGPMKAFQWMSLPVWDAVRLVAGHEICRVTLTTTSSPSSTSLRQATRL